MSEFERNNEKESPREYQYEIEIPSIELTDAQILERYQIMNEAKHLATFGVRKIDEVDQSSMTESMKKKIAIARNLTTDTWNEGDRDAQDKGKAPTKRNKKDPSKSHKTAVARVQK